MVIEHKAVTDCMDVVKNNGHEIVYADTNPNGLVNMDSVNRIVNDYRIDLVKLY